MNTFDALNRYAARAGLIRNGDGKHLDVLLIEAPAFSVDALCAQVDPDLWFPDKGESTAGAKRVCNGCPVRQECLAYALDHDERYGVWGGLSERERRRLKRRNPATTDERTAS